MSKNHHHHHDFSALEMAERESNARNHLIIAAVLTGRSIDDVMGRPEPPTLLTLPIRVPYDALKRIVETFIPRDIPTPNFTKYDGREA